MPRRRPLRLPHFDYARNGMYFVTLCVEDRRPLFGWVEDTIVRRSALGDLVAAEIGRLGERFGGVGVDLSIVMPDHVHAIVALGGQSRTLGTVVGSLKATSAIAVNRCRGTKGERVWQRGFYEHVIRDDADLDRVREYIVTNPVRWTLRHEGDASRRPYDVDRR